MKYSLQILSLLAIHWTAKAGKLGAHGNEGEHLDIKCPYPDRYLHLPKYLCRDPCGKKDVLIRAEMSDTYERSGRFSVYDNSLGRYFTVTIRQLKLQDGAWYYCGIDRWGKDWMDKVRVTVSKAVVPAATLPPLAAGTVQTSRDSPHSSSIRTPGMAFTDQSMETATLPFPYIYLDGNKGAKDHFIAVGAALGVLVCLFLAALAVLLRRKSVSKSLALKPADLSVPVDTIHEEEDSEHVYDEYVETAVYSTIGLPREDSEEGYCTVQFSDLPPGADENALYSPYSLVMSH